MLAITLGTNPSFTLPALNFGGTPAGIDARLVVDSGILPIINTGIAHKKAGVGQIGAGVTTAPMACFCDVLAALAQSLPAGKDRAAAVSAGVARRRRAAPARRASSPRCPAPAPARRS